ncbi:hypothetical protein PybrP1_006972, partial [[Pythium] brassicae (nom. inval.)]
QRIRFSAPLQQQHVVPPVFASLVRKTGLSAKALRKLDAAAQEATARDGEDAFPIAVALSGGADSMALTLLLREHLQRQQVRTPLLAITVDHRLRPESSQEAADVGRMVTERWGVAHVVAQCEWAGEAPLGADGDGAERRPAKPRGSKLQEEARKYRYALLQQVCREKRVKCLFVAHNLGDQLETVLLRLGRASGINGLAGIASASTLQGSSFDDEAEPSSGAGDGDDDDERSESDSDADAGVRLLRPLLSISKAQLKETCRHFRQKWVEDPSNDKLVFDRIRIRKELERVEAEQGPNLLHLLSRFQQSAAKAKREFARAERRVLRKYIVEHSSELVVLRMSFLDDEQMFEELSFRVVSEIVLAVGRKDTPPRLAAVARLVRELRQLETGKTLTLGGCRMMKPTPRAPEVGRERINESDETAQDALESGDAKEEKLKVVVRVRPLQKSEEPWATPAGGQQTDAERDAKDSSGAGSSSLCIQDNHMLWEKNGQVKILMADAVFPESTPQRKVFESVQDCVEGLFAGYDCSVFAYGQTGTGKTYTMSGLKRDTADGADADRFRLKDSYGVVPRGVEKLFARMEQERAASKNNVSAKEAKGESGVVTHRAGWNCVKPGKETPSLQIRQKLDGSVFVDGLTSRNLSSPLEMLQAFREGSMNREVRDNLYNQHSSRGHSIFQITLRKNILAADTSTSSSPGRGSSAKASPQSRLSRLFFVDLAGSEKWHMTGSDLSDKYAGELASINRSLSALTNCALRCRPIRKKVFNSDLMGDQRLYYEQQIQTMRVEVTRLRELLKKARVANGDFVESSIAAANSALVEENRRLKELLMNSERTRLEVQSRPGLTSWRLNHLQAPSKQPKSYSHTEEKSGRAEDTTPSRIVEPLTDDDVEDDSSEFGKSMQQMGSLLNSLHSKEARLNWMLEAEMEAQNTKQVAAPAATTSPSTGQADATADSLEKRLRSLVQVPPPLRSGAQIGTGESSSAGAGGQSIAAISSAPSAAKSLEEAAAGGRPRSDTAAPSQAAPASRLTHAISSRDDDALNSLAFGTSKLDSPREPTLVKALQPSAKLKSASILKLVATDKLGKSREELVDEYKRARRAELEAMLRTMVHK